MGIVKIKKTNVGEQVYQQMKNQILSGEWLPGEKMPSEHMLMELFGVSRDTIRQAMQQLVGENLIETRRGEGSFVRVNRLEDYFKPIFLASLSEKEMEEVYTFRALFEGVTAEMAALKATEAQIQRLEENLKRLQQTSGNHEQFVQADGEFHALICECAGNTLAAQIFNAYQSLAATPSISATTEINVFGHELKYHSLVLDAIKNRDSQLAQAAMREHMEVYLAQLQRQFKD